jgi:hypothetical protein
LTRFTYPLCSFGSIVSVLSYASRLDRVWGYRK